MGGIREGENWTTSGAGPRFQGVEPTDGPRTRALGLRSRVRPQCTGCGLQAAEPEVREQSRGLGHVERPSLQRALGLWERMWSLGSKELQTRPQEESGQKRGSHRGGA